MNRKQRIKQLENELTKIKEERRQEEIIENEKEFKNIPEISKRYHCYFCNKETFKKMKRFKFKNYYYYGKWVDTYICDECLNK